MNWRLVKQIDIIIVVVFIIIRTWMGLETELSSYKLCYSSEGPGLDSQPPLVISYYCNPTSKRSSVLFWPLGTKRTCGTQICMYVCKAPPHIK